MTNKGSRSAHCRTIIIKEKRNKNENMCVDGIHTLADDTFEYPFLSLLCGAIAMLCDAVSPKRSLSEFTA